MELAGYLLEENDVLSVAVTNSLLCLSQIINNIKVLIKSMSQTWRDHVLPCMREDQQEHYNALRVRLGLERVTVKAPSEADKLEYEKQMRL